MASPTSRRLARWVFANFWTPVGAGVKSQEEIDALALYLFGGSSTRTFVLALLIGVVSGTYSSIFNASQLLVAWDNGEIQDRLRRITRSGKRSGNEPTVTGA